MSLKQKLYNNIQVILQEKLKVIQSTISDIQSALLSETKSTAGDKHETGRAMLQLEREKTGQQLLEIQKQFELLNKVNLEIEQKNIALGSVVYTSQSNYFIAVSAGKINIGEQVFYAISPATPVGKLLLSKSEGDTFNFNNQSINILKVL